MTSTERARLDALRLARAALLEQAALEEQAGPRADSAEQALAQWERDHGPEYAGLLALSKGANP